MRWEYRVENDEDWKSVEERAERLTNIGHQGWELIAVITQRAAPPVMYFKRPKEYGG